MNPNRKINGWMCLCGDVFPDNGHQCENCGTFAIYPDYGDFTDETKSRNQTKVKCRRCNNPGKPYEVAQIKTWVDTNGRTNYLNWYRCYCYFCDDCIKKVMIEKQDHYYIPLGKTEFDLPTDWDALELAKYLKDRKRLITEQQENIEEIKTALKNFDNHEPPEILDLEWEGKKMKDMLERLK